MHVIRPSSFDELVLVWLRSEWERVPEPRPPDRYLVDEPDLSDPDQNSDREGLLRRERGKIVDGLPGDFEVYLVDIEQDDLPRVYIVPTFDWYLDTGRTFRVVDTPGHLRAGRGYQSSQGPVAIQHRQRVDEIAPSFVGYNAATTAEILVVIAADLAGPYIVIDGTHRSAALYRHFLTQANAPWRAILALSSDMADSIWHIRSPEAQASFAALERAVASGSLW